MKKNKFNWTLHEIRIEKIISVPIRPLNLFWRFQL